MCRVLLAPYFPSVAPGNLARPSLQGLPSRAQAAQLPALLGRASGASTFGHTAASAQQVLHDTTRGYHRMPCLPNDRLSCATVPAVEQVKQACLCLLDSYESVK